METSPRPLRVAITGASGLLGCALVPLLVSRGHTVIAAHHHLQAVSESKIITVALDLLDKTSLTAFVRQAHAEWVIHCAALTDVDRCEREPELAWAMNTEATRYLTDALADIGGRHVFLSTDYVFDGTDGPYAEDASPNPINAYGRTKLAAEQIVRDSSSGSAIIRSASFLGIGVPGHPTWVDRMAATILNEPPLLVATDQCSNITPIEFLASAIVEIVESGQSGLRHIAGDQILSRHEFAGELARLFGLSGDVLRAVHYHDLKRPAPRPLSGGLVTRFPVRTPQLPLSVALARWSESFLQQLTH